MRRRFVVFKQVLEDLAAKEFSNLRPLHNPIALQESSPELILKNFNYS
jgi:hypothetical protein